MLRRYLKNSLERIAIKIRRYQPLTAVEHEKRAGPKVSFRGDVPSVGGIDQHQFRALFKQERPQTEIVTDVLYTPRGHAWVEGTLVEKYSARAPSIKEIFGRPTRKKTKKNVDEAWIIESETPVTYGDWVGDHIRALVEADRDIGPVLLPGEIAQKSYVKRDIARLGLNLLSADENVLIKKAHVLRRTLPSYYWGKEQVRAYQERFGMDLVEPKKGSLLYLSRDGFESEVLHRHYPSKEIAKIIESLGGTVFDTRNASPEAFVELAELAETIVADQGSAIFGVLQWKCKNLIEITTDHWWHNANLFFAHAAGVENYSIIVCEKYDTDQLRHRLLELLPPELAARAE